MASALLSGSSCFNNRPDINLKNSYLNNPTNLFHLRYPRTKNPKAPVWSRSSLLAISNSQIQNRRPGFWRTTAASNSKFYKRLDTCLVIPPPQGRKPKAIIKFIGGAFIGAVPEVTYGSDARFVHSCFCALFEIENEKCIDFVFLILTYAAVIYLSNWQAKGIS